MWRKVFLLGAITALVSGCMTAEEQRAADEAKCRSYGFAKRNDAFAECMQRIDLDRSANARANLYDYWGRPYYPYSRYYYLNRANVADRAAEKGR
ncbi:hypothetical protein [Mesorhizobium sp. 1B3]|uniref:hypothetical protein n=1 Tax=Mesorhizobium sp. 1B3 TaxID=3243599 RepID=UPI003D99F497